MEQRLSKHPRGVRDALRNAALAGAGVTVMLSLLSACSAGSGRSTTPNPVDQLRPALVSLTDLDSGWEALWDPNASTNGATSTDPAIETALDNLSTCTGQDAAVFLTDAEPTVTGSTLIGPLTAAGTGPTLQGQIDSYAYAARGVATDLHTLHDADACLATYTAERIAASLDDPALTLSEVSTTRLSEDLAQGVVGVRFELTISSGENEIPVSSTLLAAGSGNFVVFYDLTTVGGQAPQEFVTRLATLLNTRVSEVSRAL